MTVFLEKFANKIINLNKKVENIKSKKPEIIVLILYCVLHIIISIFHEPWFDEAVAWQIAKVANIKDILFEIPHYEGHPPLWHLVLLPFAKLGAPYEFSLSFVSLIFTGLTMYLILFKSPFTRLVNLLLPFNYFMFYQYGVISRPYCMMMLAFVLLAILYKKHNEKPFLYALGLVFLCLTSAYGIVIAGGIAIAWIIELILEKGFINFIKDVFKDKRIYALLVLLLVACELIWLILPCSDTSAVVSAKTALEETNIFVRLTYMFVLIFADLTLVNIFNYNSGFLRMLEFDFGTVPGAFILGLIILIGILYFAKVKKKVMQFFIPYFLFGFFSAIVYLSPHHIGILQLLLIFWLWIALEETTIFYGCGKFQDSDKKILYNFIIFLSTICFCIPIFWNIASCIGDIVCDYSVGRREADFIKENKLTEYKILTNWLISYDDNGQVLSMNTNLAHSFSSMAPYFENNICYNFMDGDDSKNYINHKSLSESDNIKNLESWRKKGVPDVILGSAKLDFIFEKEEVTYDDYALVYLKKHKRIWKMPNRSNYIVPIFIKKDLLLETGLTEIDKVELPLDWHIMIAGENLIDN